MGAYTGRRIQNPVSVMYIIRDTEPYKKYIIITIIIIIIIIIYFLKRTTHAKLQARSAIQKKIIKTWQFKYNRICNNIHIIGRKNSYKKKYVHKTCIYIYIYRFSGQTFFVINFFKYIYIYTYLIMSVT